MRKQEIDWDKVDVLLDIYKNIDMAVVIHKVNAFAKPKNTIPLYIDGKKAWSWGDDKNYIITEGMLTLEFSVIYDNCMRVYRIDVGRDRHKKIE